MSLEAKVMDRLKQAMKDKNEAALRTLRAIKAAILVEKTAEGRTGALTEADELKLLQKMAKQRKESIEIYLQQNRQDLAQVEQEELSILEEFLPKAMSAEELSALVAKVIAESGATGPRDMGKVMGLVNAAVAGRAEGKTVADEVKSQLAKLNG